MQNGQLNLTRVAGQDLCSHVRHFLGYHMIKEFEVLDFLEEAGLQRTLWRHTQDANKLTGLRMHES